MIQRLMNKLKSWLDKTFQGQAILGGLAVILPFILLTHWLSDKHWQKASIIALSALLFYRAVKPGPLLVLLHGAAMMIGIYLLFIALSHTWLFVSLCAGMAALVICLAGWDQALRSLGTWIFIPVVYTTLENSTELHTGYQQAVTTLLPYLMVGVLPVFLWSLASRSYAWLGLRQQVRYYQYLGRWHHLGHPLGNGLDDFILPALSTALAVGICAWLVRHDAIPEGQWLIWSCVSVSTGDMESALKKVKDRALGAMIGVPIGILLGLFLVPHNPGLVELIGILSVMTIFCLRNYILAFTGRCIASALIITLLGGNLLQETSRLLNVVGGGLIGFLLFYALYQAHVITQRHRHKPTKN